MPLNKSILEVELIKIMDKDDSSSFEGFPKDAKEVGERWANALDAYASAVTPPSTTPSAAKVASERIFATASPILANAAIVLPQAFLAYATILAGGMSGYTGVPPAGVLDLSTVFAIGLGGGSGSDCAAEMANKVDIWFKTGTATLIVPPNTVLNWI